MNIQIYCIKHQITLSELFERAWQDQRNSAADASVAHDLGIYKKYKAIPSYVEDFLKGQPRRVFGLTPYYAQ